MNLDLAYDELLPHPIDDVWRQLTDGAAISDWLMPTVDFRPFVGARFHLKTEHLSRDGWVEARILELEPPRRMVWLWTGSDGLPSTVTFELTSEGDGTRLRLTHTGEGDPTVINILRDGWPGRIELIRRSLG